MRIERVEIDGFGRFHDARWELGEGLTVLVGENEAGKSTLLNAIRALLFGFESTRDGRTWYPALGGGRRGGRLVLRTASGERWTVERHGDRGGGGALVVRAPNGNQGGQETLDRLLHGADRDLFMNIFAFGLGELQAIGSLSGEGVRNRIYGAGSGLGGINALDLERRLRAEQEATYKPRGRDTSLETLNGLLARIDELHGEIATLEQQPAEYEAARAELASLAARRVEVAAERLKAAERGERLRRVLVAQPACAELERLQSELAAGDPSDDALPPDAEARYDRRATALEAASGRLRDLDARLERIDARLAEIAPDDRLAAVAAAAAALRDERAVHDGRATELAAARADANRHETGLRELARRSGSWSANELLHADDSIAAVDATREHERALATSRAAFEDRRRRRDALIDEAERDGGVTEREAAGAGLEARAAALEALVRHDIRVESQAAGSVPGWAVAGVLVLAAIGVGAAGVLADAPLAGLVGAAALGVLALAALRLLARGAVPVADRAVLAERAGLAAGATAAEVAAARDEVATERARAALTRDDARRREERGRLIERAERDLEAATAASEAAAAAWVAWLAHRRLPEQLSPESARATLALVDAARRSAADHDEAQRRAEAIAAAAASYDERLASLLRATGREVPQAGPPRAAALVQLVADIERDATLRRQCAELQAERAELASAREPLVAVRDAARSELNALLVALHAADEDALRAAATRAVARRALQAEVRESRAGLIAIAGGEAALPALVAQARELDPSAVEAQREAAQAGVERLDAEEREALTRAGALGERVKVLETSEELGRRRQELAELQARAEAEAHRWAVRAATLRLLGETRQRYERERQPDVVRDAERHFERITGGRWPRIIAPPGEPSVEVETEGGEVRRPEELSRGTAEQLYLALRFGLIEQFTRLAEPLPVVMDEILVNFDPARAARTAAAITDLATRHQVLYFTCQPPTAELLDPDRRHTIALG
ncbi:MAG: AAA family ATPase [Chloroflexota bacterium]